MKKRFNILSIFELDLTRRDYKVPLIRMGVSALIAMIVCLFRVGVTLVNPFVNVVVSLLCIAVVVISILCFFIAAVEALQVGDNRKRDKARAKDKYKNK